MRNKQKLLANKIPAEKWVIMLAIIVSLFMTSCGFADAQTYTFGTQWGIEGIGDGQFNQPVGIAVDSSGNVYVADSGNSRIQKFSSNGKWLTKWGSFGSGDGEFNEPLGVAVDLAGNVYVADSGNRRIQRFSSAGEFLGQWRSFVNEEFVSYPKGVALDAAGNVFVIGVDAEGRVEKYSHEGVLKGKWNTTVDGDNAPNEPAAICTDTAGDVYVVDAGNEAIKKFTSKGIFITQWTNDQFKNVNAIAVDTLTNIYTETAILGVSNESLQTGGIQKFFGNGNLQTGWGSFGSGEGEFWNPRGLAVDAAGNVYVADTLNNRIQKFSPQPQKFGPSLDTLPTAVILAVLVTAVVVAYGVGKSSLKKQVNSETE